MHRRGFLLISINDNYSVFVRYFTEFHSEILQGIRAGDEAAYPGSSKDN